MLSVIISGLPAVGKTTVAKALSAGFGLRYYGGGDALKELAIKRGYRPSGEDWWDTAEGMRFLEERKRDPNFDKEVDRILTRAVSRGDVVVTSYPLPWLTRDGIKIWLRGSPMTRARRMANRDGIAVSRAVRIVAKRDRENRALYKALYGIRFGEDFSVFDFLLNTDPFRTEQVIEIASTLVRHLR